MRLKNKKFRKQSIPLIVLAALILVFFGYKLLRKAPVTNEPGKAKISKTAATPLGKFCGGKSNISCAAGYECVSFGNYPEERGTCRAK